MIYSEFKKKFEKMLNIAEELFYETETSVKGLMSEDDKESLHRMFDVIDSMLLNADVYYYLADNQIITNGIIDCDGDVYKINEVEIDNKVEVMVFEGNYATEYHHDGQWVICEPLDDIVGCYGRIRKKLTS